MSDQPTCGKGIAAHAVIPNKLGELIDALADNLEHHLPSLTATDAATRSEHGAYTSLAAQHRDVARRLRTLGQEMLSYRSLAMGTHDEQVLASPGVVTAFEGYIATLRSTIAALQATLGADQQLVAG